MESWILLLLQTSIPIGQIEALWGTIIGLLIWMVKTWWGQKVNRKKLEEEEFDKVKVVKKIGNGNGQVRTLSRAVEHLHDDVQAHKEITRVRFEKLLEDVGRIKGKLDIP